MKTNLQLKVAFRQTAQWNFHFLSFHNATVQVQVHGLAIIKMICENGSVLARTPHKFHFKNCICDGLLRYGRAVSPKTNQINNKFSHPRFALRPRRVEMEMEIYQSESICKMVQVCGHKMWVSHTANTRHENPFLGSVNAIWRDGQMKNHQAIDAVVNIKNKKKTNTPNMKEN